MTTNQEAIKQIEKIIENNNLSESEVVKIFKTENTNFIKPKTSINKILIYIGGLIIFFGIIFFIQTNWKLLNSFSRTMVTLGFGITSYIAALILEKKQKFKILINLLHLISIGLLPIGLFIYSYEINLLLPYKLIVSAILITLLSMHYLSANAHKPRMLFQFMLIIYLNYLYLNLFSIIDKYGYLKFEYLKINELSTIILGISNLLIGYHYSKYKISKFYNLVGSTFYLSGFFILTDIEKYDIFFNILYPFILIGILTVGSICNRKSILIPTIGFFIFYLFNINSKYFSDTMEWPASLILIGLTLIISSLTYIKIKKNFSNKP